MCTVVPGDIQTTPFWFATSLLVWHLQSLFKVLLGHSLSCPPVMTEALASLCVHLAFVFHGCPYCWGVLCSLCGSFLLHHLNGLLRLDSIAQLQRSSFLRVHAYLFVQQLLSPWAPPLPPEIKLTREDALSGFTNLMLRQGHIHLILLLKKV